VKKTLSLCLMAGRAICAPVFNVADYGARGDGSEPATDAIRHAIEAAHTAGGGTVYIPAGRYITGPIELVSNLVLHIEAGATLSFPAARLPYTKGRTQGIETVGPVPLIGGHDLENATITGRGVITTDNAEWVRLMGGATPRSASGPGSAFGPDWNRLLADLQTQTPRQEAEYLKIAPFLRPAFIRFMDSRNILVEGIHMIGAPFWSIHMLYSENIAIHNVTLGTFPGIFTGGIYIDSSRDVRISDSSFDNGDDAIALNAGKDADGLRVNRSTENVTISNVVVHRGSGCIVMGSETSGGIRNVVVSNVVCQNTQNGINIKSERGRGGSVEDVRIDNVEMDNVGRAISISQFYQMQGEQTLAQEPVSRRTPVFRNIAITHVTISRARGVIDYSWNPDGIAGVGAHPPQPLTIDIAGLPEMPIAGLRMTDLVSNSPGGLRASNTVGMELHNVQMNTEGVPGFLIRDSRDLELDGVSSRQPVKGMPVLRLDRCAGAVVRNSHAFSGTGTFLSAGPGEIKGMRLIGNALGHAAKATEESTVDFWREP